MLFSRIVSKAKHYFNSSKKVINFTWDTQYRWHLFKSYSNKSCSTLQSCLITAPNQTFQRCCKQLPSKILISSMDQPFCLAWFVISLISNWQNLCAVEHVSVITKPHFASLDRVRSIALGTESIRLTQVGYMSTLMSHHNSNNFPITSHFECLDYWFAQRFNVLFSTIIVIDKMIVWKPLLCRKPTATFLMSVCHQLVPLENNCSYISLL